MTIGYLVPEFPGQTHGFFWREIVHIEKAGRPVSILSTRRPKDSATHAFSSVAAARTRYLADFRAADVLSWARAALAAPALLLRGDVRAPLAETNERWIKMLALATIGLRLKSIGRREGITHIHGHSCADAAYVLAFSRLAGGPSYSLSLHGDLEVYGRGHAFKFRPAKFVACVTEALCRQVEANVPGLTEPPKLIRMGIEYDLANQKTGDWSAADSLKIVTVARLNQMKGHRHAIAAVRALVDQGIDIRYDIIGEGDYAAEIQATIAKAGLEDRVRMLGPVPNDAVAGLLAGYDAFVLPSVGLGEAAPVAVMEAMSVGLPVVCSIIGGTPEMIEHGKTGFLFPQGDEAALGEILGDLARRPAMREAIGSAGRAHAHANFLTSVSAATLVDAIER
ncbi:MAG: glycosyltransferase family 4 protein [Sphingomonadales bacterium]|nr:glycosyltransferase family 4 protein [Sphingomonadales bacterium]